MDDRITEIREALVWYDYHGPSKIKSLRSLVEAARAYADLLSEVERIKAEEWPKDWPRLLLAAVAPSQGVDHG